MSKYVDVMHFDDAQKDLIKTFEEEPELALKYLQPDKYEKQSEKVKDVLRAYSHSKTKETNPEIYKGDRQKTIAEMEASGKKPLKGESFLTSAVYGFIPTDYDKKFMDYLQTKVNNAPEGYATALQDVSETENPISSLLGNVAGGFAQGMMLPSVKGAGFKNLAQLKQLGKESAIVGGTSALDTLGGERDMTTAGIVGAVAPSALRGLGQLSKVGAGALTLNKPSTIGRYMDMTDAEVELAKRMQNPVEEASIAADKLKTLKDEDILDASASANRALKEANTADYQINPDDVKGSVDNALSETMNMHEGFLTVEGKKQIENIINNLGIHDYDEIPLPMLRVIKKKVQGMSSYDGKAYGEEANDFKKKLAFKLNDLLLKSSPQEYQDEAIKVAETMAKIAPIKKELFNNENIPIERKVLTILNKIKKGSLLPAEREAYAPVIDALGGEKAMQALTDAQVMRQLEGLNVAGSRGTQLGRAMGKSFGTVGEAAGAGLGYVSDITARPITRGAMALQKKVFGTGIDSIRGKLSKAVQDNRLEGDKAAEMLRILENADSKSADDLAFAQFVLSSQDPEFKSLMESK